MRDNRNELYKNFMKVAKRVAITILCCIPVCVLFAYFARTVITSNVLQCVCFIAIMGAAVLVVEIVSRAKEKKKQEEAKHSTKKDVFK